eukprot:CAMPEP_0203805492 /NCGR_PEP_ID=MMETSP0100_2-20121128/14271_1 /ASSEMBLY_ACC=CAM_ASM_000210 /TAXON_ID=96639 /ORGANISM=" , Strain NY0313808BC1" /LENGTH=130 /DNA_ID=CAMNT_0050714029 /DNA_START=91 /DNA_END=483 /DNA_ORIENTATION=+
MMRPALPLASDGSRFFSSGVESVNVTFIDADGEKETVKAEIGMNLLDVAHENDIEVEGACGGEMACSTCHMIFEKEAFAKFPEPEEEEEDMLDLALGLTDTSRLGCQVIVTKDMDGITVQLPKETASMLE